MPDLEARLQALRAKVTGLQQAKARADHEAAVAGAREEAALQALRDEFAVSGLEAARELLARCEDDLASACGRAEQELKEAGG